MYIQQNHVQRAVWPVLHKWEAVSVWKRFVMVCLTAKMALMKTTVVCGSFVLYEMISQKEIFIGLLDLQDIYLVHVEPQEI